jgi:hypothetical protein
MAEDMSKSQIYFTKFVVSAVCVQILYFTTMNLYE